MVFYRSGTAAVLLLALCILPAFAVGTQFWTSATYEDFARGNFKNVSLGREGSVTLSPALEPVLDTEQAMIWAVARDARGNVYLGTGHSGKVFRLGPDLKSTLLFDAAEPDIFALAVDKDNRLYIGTSPDGKIYRVEASGQSSEFFDPKTKYIWSMTFASDGALYVGTGDRGRIFRVRADGTGDVFYETHQTHVMSLAVTPQGELIAGSEPDGLLYRISGEGKAFVLYDSPLAEIHQVSLAPDGSIYAATLGAGDTRQLRQTPQQPSGSPAPVQAAATITVRASEDPLQIPGPQGAPEEQPEEPQPDAGAAAVRVATGPRVTAGTPRSQQRGAARSAIVRIRPDSTVETLWSSPSENAFDLASSDNRLLFSTDEKGRIYQLIDERELSLLTQTDQEQTTRLIPMGDFVLVTTANLGKVFRLGTDPAANGSFESDVRDAENMAGWGQVRWTADVPAGASLELFTRSGNSPRPDSTWSDWSAAYKNPLGEAVTSPPARYVQWKAEFRSAGNLSPILREVTLAYLPRNRAPEITEVKAVSRANRQAQAGSSGGTAVITAGGTGAAVNRALAAAVSAGRSNPQRGVDISWLASDADQDELTYQLYFRGEGESEWKLLQEDLKQNYFQLDPDSLPDGSYRVKVIASDAAQNAAPAARTGEHISAPFIVDYTPPLVEVENIARTGTGALVRFRAADGASVLTRAEYVVDAQSAKAWLSDDGIVDSQQETFSLQLASLDPQEHLVTLRVYDSTGNVGAAKAVLPPLGSTGTGQVPVPSGGR